MNNSKEDVKLVDCDLWKQFHCLSTEMIITKLGRRMFPGFRVQMENLEPNACYLVFLDMVPVDLHRYTYSNGAWRIANANDYHIPSHRVYVHPDSPNFGTRWMESIVSFAKVKLTNNSEDSTGNLILTSMHKYVPRVTLVGFRQTSAGPAHTIQHFSFAETEFVAVTAYQNEMITDLKIRLNPFARGFRKRRWQDDDEVAKQQIVKTVALQVKGSKKRKTDYANIDSLINKDE
ncbi:hypothetical protein ACOME3_006507 [Neoechinorhynchus agilis]